MSAFASVEIYSPGTGYGAQMFRRNPVNPSDGAAMTFSIEDRVDTTPPIVGEPRVTGEVFTNECGAKALVWTDEGSFDESGFGPRLPVLVEIRSETNKVYLYSSTFGFTNDANFNLISRLPFLGQCIGREGLETLDFERGETVEISITLYDYSLNAGRTVSQTLEWPL